MITLLTGENSFENERALQRLVAETTILVERVDGASLTIKQLPDLLMGATLFAEKRFVVLRNLSENKSLWSDFGTWLPRISDDIHVVLVEAKPDKRTKTYKDLQKVASIQESKSWTDRDGLKAEQWVVTEAKRLGFELDKKCAHFLVARVGIDQWQLSQALEKLAVVGTVSLEVIETLIEANPTENVFNLLETALRGDTPRIREMVQTLEVNEDPYRLFGLLSSQGFQLAALSVTDKASSEVAKELGAHPFVLSKLAPHARKLGSSGARKLIMALAEADSGMKTSSGEPWLLIERALIKITRI
ncbi:MAG: polymerase subunit delta [Candidatus Saccharibacteria bacterium]|jgi:DNA polymerase-3 subunit delta|nr:polymerase subunit delta [Candidatus Saccharibacteria bacterium]